MWQKEEFVWLVQGQSKGQSLLICDYVCVWVCYEDTKKCFCKLEQNE